MAKLDNSKITILASGLGYPEGPIHCSDGSIMFVEIKNEQLSIIPAGGGAVHKVASIPGGPNGAAVAPNGEILVCNDGGFTWIPIPDAAKPIVWVAGNQPANYLGGSLQSVDVSSGNVADLVTTVKHREFPPGNPAPDWAPPYDLKGLDDLVVDEAGGVWFTDYGKIRERDKDITGVYYLSPDRKTVTQKVYPLNNPNGIALSPDGSRLYVALTFERKIVYYDLKSPGEISPNTSVIDGSNLLTANLEGQSVLDSMAVDSEGNVYVATMLPEGNNPVSNGGISVISPDGNVEYVPINLPNNEPAPLPSNICFGGEDMKTAYITCGGSGHLISMPCTVAGLKLNHGGSEFDPSTIPGYSPKKARGE